MIVVSSIQGVSMSSVTICEIDMRSSPPSAWRNNRRAKFSPFADGASAAASATQCAQSAAISARGVPSYNSLKPSVARTRKVRPAPRGERRLCTTSGSDEI